MKIEIHSSTPETREWKDKATGERRSRDVQTAYLFFGDEPYPTPMEVGAPASGPYKVGVYQLGKSSFRVNNGRLEIAFGCPIEYVGPFEKS